MTDAPPDPDPKLDIDWLKTLAGALAAVTTAVLLSTLGAAGTLVGAALGSVAATVGTALYTRGLATSREQVARVQGSALQKVGIAQAEVRRAARRQDDAPAVEAHLEHADEQLAEARQDLDAVEERPRTGLPWKRIGLLAAGTFVAVVLALSAFELLGGKPVSSYTGGTDGSGGTSFSRLTGSGGQSQDDDRGDQQRPDRGDRDQDDDQPVEPSDDPTPTPSGEPTEAEPSETPSETPSQSPTPTPSETPAPSGSTSPSPSAPTTSPGG